MAWFPFVVGVAYTREDITDLLGVPDAVGSHWYSAYHRHRSEYYVFANVGASAGTGRDKPSRWEGERLRWFGKPGSRLSHPSIRMLLQPATPVRMFCREQRRAPFVYHGLVAPVELKDTVPVEVLWEFRPKSRHGLWTPARRRPTDS